MKNEFDEDALINYVTLETDGDEELANMVTLPVPETDAALFVVGQEYQVEVKVTIPDRSFTPFVRIGGTEIGRL